MNIIAYHPRAEELMGLIPHFLDEYDPRPAAEQFNERYAHGGGWSPMKGWTMPTTLHIEYSGDEPLHALAEIEFRNEAILVFPHAWVCIMQPDGSFEVARMD